MQQDSIIEAGHEVHCACQDCEAKIINQFQGFASCRFHAKAAGLYRPCPDCGRMIKPRRRRCFLVWSCWQCVRKDAAVTRIVFGESGKPEYGFAVNDEDMTLYFHLNRQVYIQFDGSDHPAQSDFTQSMDASVRPNDIILYQEFIGNRGPKALWWAFEAEYHNVLVQIASRLTYRFVRRDGREAQSRLQAQPKYRVMWEGKDLNEVSGMLPAASVNGYDPNAFYACYWHYLDHESNDWFLCGDPRG